MCVEITATGAFNGIGRAVPPAIVGIVGNLMRIPFAYILSYTLVDYLPEFQNWISSESVSATGVWWGLTISSILKGSILFLWFLFLLNKDPENQSPIPLKRLWIRIIPSRLRQSSTIINPIENEEFKKRA
jgi:Na+-driven multidrug efflux pump